MARDAITVAVSTVLERKERRLYRRSLQRLYNFILIFHSVLMER